MICPRCLENNPDSYRFCGMCGDDLQVATSSSGAPLPKIPNASPQPQAARRPSPPQAAVSELTEPISGPSLLGLDQPISDPIADTAFSSFDTYDEQPDSGWKKALVLLLIVGALAGAGWWGYKIGWWGGNLKPIVRKAIEPSSQPAAPAPDSAAKPVTEAQNSAPAATPPASVPESHAESSNAGETKPATSVPAPAETVKTNEQPAPESAKPQPNAVVTPQPRPAAAKPALPAVPAADSTDAMLRQGEAYLYGRGVGESCPQAMKYLKSAADKGNAKARSMLGTMYSTGHCVPRDLPSSYRWFALALRSDPNNQILVKDLGAVWSQMTLPERQLAMKNQ